MDNSTVCTLSVHMDLKDVMILFLAIIIMLMTAYGSIQRRQTGK